MNWTKYQIYRSYRRRRNTLHRIDLLSSRTNLYPKNYHYTFKITVFNTFDDKHQEMFSVAFLNKSGTMSNRDHLLFLNLIKQKIEQTSSNVLSQLLLFRLNIIVGGAQYAVLGNCANSRQTLNYFKVSNLEFHNSTLPFTITLEMICPSAILLQFLLFLVDWRFLSIRRSSQLMEKLYHIPNIMF